MKEKKRNSFGLARLYTNYNNFVGKMIYAEKTEFTNKDFIYQLSRIKGIKGTVKNNQESIKIGQEIAKPDIRLNLSEKISENQVICCTFLNPEYKKHIPRVLLGANIPRKSVSFRDIFQSDRRHAGECLSIRLTEKIMGADRDTPMIQTTYINLKNQPHQRDYIDHDKAKADSTGPMIYKVWKGPPPDQYRKPMSMAPPPGPLNIQYRTTPRPPQIQEIKPPRPQAYEPKNQDIYKPQKRTYSEASESQQVQSQKIPKIEDDRVEQAKLAVQAFFNLPKNALPKQPPANPAPIVEDPRMRNKLQTNEPKKDEKKEDKKPDNAFMMFMSK